MRTEVAFRVSERVFAYRDGAPIITEELLDAAASISDLIGQPLSTPKGAAAAITAPAVCAVR
jgi:hypothetical protein